jgi:hypothetical protein
MKNGSFLPIKVPDIGGFNENGREIYTTLFQNTVLLTLVFIAGAKDLAQPVSVPEQSRFLQSANISTALLNK